MEVTRSRLANLDTFIAGRIGVFIASASFERRCLAIAQNMDANRVSVAVIGENENHQDLHLNHRSQLESIFGVRTRMAWLDTTNPLKSADALSRALVESDEPAREGGVVVDITAFTHEAVLMLFLLLRRMRLDRVTYVYAGAGEYSVGDPAEKKWLSKGVGEVRSILGYAGRLLPSRRLHLIVLVGFEHDRVAELIRAYEPSLVSIGIGESEEPGASVHYEANRYGVAMVKSLCPSANEFRFQCHDPVATKAAIELEVKRHSDMNVVVAPMNTKLSTLGAGLAAMDDPTIQLCYAQALLYNTSNYSVAGDVAYIVRDRDLPNTPVLDREGLRP